MIEELEDYEFVEIDENDNEVWKDKTGKIHIRALPTVNIQQKLRITLRDVLKTNFEKLVRSSFNRKENDTWGAFGEAIVCEYFKNSGWIVKKHPDGIYKIDTQVTKNGKSFYPEAQTVKKWYSEIYVEGANKWPWDVIHVLERKTDMNCPDAYYFFVSSDGQKMQVVSGTCMSNLQLQKMPNSREKKDEWAYFVDKKNSKTLDVTEFVTKERIQEIRKKYLGDENLLN